MDRGYFIEVDLINRILKLKVYGLWKLKDAKEYEEEFMRKSSVLIGKDWYVLADIKDYPPQFLDVQNIHKKLMIYAKDNGMKKSANIVGKTLTHKQIKRLVQESYLTDFEFFSDEKEAIKWLLAD